MTYKDIYNWALMKMENEKKAEKLLGCHIPLMYEQAEKELILECCPKSAMLPMSEISIFNVEEILKSREKILELKKLLSILESDILKLKDEFGETEKSIKNIIEKVDED